MQEGENVSCSATHCVQVEHDGSLLLWLVGGASNRFGQLCAGDLISNAPEREQEPNQAIISAPDESRIIAAAAGGGTQSGHTVFATSKGAVFTCGCDRWLQLGLGQITGGSNSYSWENGRAWKTSAQRVEAMKEARIVDVAAGEDHTVVLTDDGRVFAFGRGDQGQVTGGKGRGPFTSAPRECVSLKGATAIEAQGACTCAWMGHGGPPRFAGKCTGNDRETLSRRACAKARV